MSNVAEAIGEFLRARLAEDEAAARAAGNLTAWKRDFGDPYLENEDTGERTPLRAQTVAEELWLNHAARHLPGRVLAECEAKRRIVGLHARDHECSTIDPHDPTEVDNCAWVLDGDNCSTLCLLALPYSDHPDYREGWRP